MKKEKLLQSATVSHVHNPSHACSCTVDFTGNAFSIRYCPLHTSAPDLLEACKSMLDWMEFTIPNLDRFKVPTRMNYGAPIFRARTAITNATK